MATGTIRGSFFIVRKSFILHIDSLGILDELTDEQAGQLFKLIYDYHNPNKPKETQKTQVVNLAFYSFKSQFDRDLEKYNNICERNKINGKDGGRPRNKNPKKPDSKNDSKNDSDSKNKSGRKKDKKEIDLTDLSFKDGYREIVERWLKYKASRKEKYKSIDSVETFYKKLLEYSNGLPELATKIIEQSISNNWAGIFELKPKSNPNNNNSMVY